MSFVAIDRNSLFTRDERQFWGNPSILQKYFKITRARSAIKGHGDTGVLNLLDGTKSELEKGQELFFFDDEANLVAQLLVQAYEWRQREEDGARELRIIVSVKEKPIKGRTVSWLIPGSIVRGERYHSFDFCDVLSQGFTVYSQQPGSAPPAGTAQEQMMAMGNAGGFALEGIAEEEDENDEEYVPATVEPAGVNPAATSSEQQPTATTEERVLRRRKANRRGAIVSPTQGAVVCRTPGAVASPAHMATVSLTQGMEDVLKTVLQQGFQEVRKELAELKALVEPATKKGHVANAKVAREQVVDSFIKKFRQDPYFMFEARPDHLDPFKVFLAGLLGYKSADGTPSVSLLQSSETEKTISYYRGDMYTNFKHAAMAEIRKKVVQEYRGLVGTEGAKAIILDKTYRDTDGKHMADARFQSCLISYYCKIRRVNSRDLHLFTDISKLEFTRHELALVDMEVQRALRGDVAASKGYLGGRSAEMHLAYKSALSIVQAWRHSDMATNLNIVGNEFVLGKASKHCLHMSAYDLILAMSDQ
ncbi:hypothetical protein VOLCADRAFT_92572 [Volvox carteri f. nagariensis]|uniref:Uncharacterized protein n=1 Tax=Volvox carteri f. nagariensis TaxID=3068 RepID=D8U005_VOLCA|nr:uncharacterized protein VOLCADRAFT_92572 [Volvox carteri f. nagariensis]EFJ47024.1 hypothetical protein VOLCADRAFT_92572 [Volvox carteri f. nagariensis]|eukprot:XP_002951919.1 hypothetical protein VOLCADRAFT_92572 [Volvox carteri f. nagariensis]